MLHNGALDHLTGQKKKPENAYLDPMIAEIMEKGEARRRITIKASLYVDREAFVPGEYLAHLPLPIEDAQQSDVRLLGGDPDGLGDARAPARTAYWRRTLDAWRPFEATYSYVTHIRYADPLGRPAPDAPLYPTCASPCAEDLGERGAYMRFTPYLRDLAQSLTAGESSDVMKAWRVYEFVTTQVTYSFVRDYFQLDDQGEYCAVNLKGDCGLQALLFILLFRMGDTGMASITPLRQLMLLGAGVITAMPMVLYSVGVKYLPLTTAGFCQYLSPTLAIVCGAVMGEYLTPEKLKSFYFIWAGVILYCLNTIYEERKRRKQLRAEPENG